MKILAILPSLYDRSPGQRFRIEQWEPLLREKGVEITYASFEDQELSSVVHKSGQLKEKVILTLKAMARRWKTIRKVDEYDVVYVFREAAIFGPAIFERLIKWSGKPMVFDFDDAIFLRSEGSVNGYLNYLKFSGKTKSICRLSTHVMSGNQYLADYAEQVNKNVTIIPTTIDTDKYTVVEKDEELPVTIGWSGSFSTVIHLNTLRTVLEKLIKKENFRLRVIGTPDYKLEGVQVDSMQWNSASELDDLRKIDIGVMPLPEDDWSRGKCGLKALQYMALGIPTICSPVGVNSDIIQDGENGFLAGNDDEWIEKLSKLIDSSDLRKKVGAKGRETVVDNFSAKSQVDRVFEVFKTAIKAKKN
jgi:glycosyltransferase involved in cell wall biosynthesis